MKIGRLVLVKVATMCSIRHGHDRLGRAAHMKIDGLGENLERAQFLPHLAILDHCLLDLPI